MEMRVCHSELGLEMLSGEEVVVRSLNEMPCQYCFFQSSHCFVYIIRQGVSALGFRERVSTLASKCEDAIANKCSRGLLFHKILLEPHARRTSLRYVQLRLTHGSFSVKHARGSQRLSKELKVCRKFNVSDENT